jgi:NitT/TauT family transport system permease protein
MFEIYSSNFLMEHMWALLLVLFALAFAIDGVFAQLEKRVEYYAAAR